MDKSHSNRTTAQKPDVSFKESLKVVQEVGGEFIHPKALRNPTEFLGEVPGVDAGVFSPDVKLPKLSRVNSILKVRRLVPDSRIPSPTFQATHCKSPSFSVDSNLTSLRADLVQLQGITQEATESHTFLPIESRKGFVALSPTRSLRFSETQNHLECGSPIKSCSIYSGCHTDSGLVPSIPNFHQDILSDDNSI